MKKERLLLLVALIAVLLFTLTNCGKDEPIKPQPKMIMPSSQMEGTWRVIYYKAPGVDSISTTIEMQQKDAQFKFYALDSITTYGDGMPTYYGTYKCKADSICADIFQDSVVWSHLEKDGDTLRITGNKYTIHARRATYYN